MKIPETSANVGAYYGNEENGQWQPNGVIIDNGVGGGVVGSGDAGLHRPPVYPLHIPRQHVNAGYVMAGAYYPQYPAPPQPDDFADYMWMENEEEFDKQVLQQLEEEALMEQCIEAMLEDEQRERNARGNARNAHNYPTTSNGAPSVSLEEAVSRSTLNPLAAEFVPTRRITTSHLKEERQEPPTEAHAEAPSTEKEQNRTEDAHQEGEKSPVPAEDSKTEETNRSIPSKKNIESAPWWSEKLQKLKREVYTRKNRIKCAAPIRRAKVVEDYLKKKEEYKLEFEKAQENWKFCEKEGIWKMVYQLGVKKAEESLKFFEINKKEYHSEVEKAESEKFNKKEELCSQIEKTEKSCCKFNENKEYQSEVEKAEESWKLLEINKEEYHSEVESCKFNEYKEYQSEVEKAEERGKFHDREEYHSQIEKAAESGKFCEKKEYHSEIEKAEESCKFSENEYQSEIENAEKGGVFSEEEEILEEYGRTHEIKDQPCEKKVLEAPTPPKDPPEVSALDVNQRQTKKDPRRPETKKPVKVEPKKTKPTVVKSETKVAPKKKDIKTVKSEIKVEIKSEETPVDVPKPQSPTPEEPPTGPKPINYAAAAKASKPKPKSTTPPAETKTPTPSATKTDKLKEIKPKIEKKTASKEKPKEKVVQRKNSAK